MGRAERIVLSDEERGRFVGWLRQQSRDEDELARQAHISGIDEVEKEFRVRAAAKEHVARELERMEAG